MSDTRYIGDPHLAARAWGFDHLVRTRASNHGNDYEIALRLAGALAFIQHSLTPEERIEVGYVLRRLLVDANEQR